MSPMALPENGATTSSTAVPNAAAAHLNGTTTADKKSSELQYISTMPPADHHWRITLEGKVIAITGANRGIGLGIAQVCLANGTSTVYSLDIFEPGEEFAALQAIFPKRLQYINCDVTAESSIQSAVNSIVSISGRVDGLVANAGMTKHQPALSFTRADLDSLFNINVFAAYNCACIFARTFIELGIKGSIVFTASMTSYRPNRAAPSAPYGATKGAVRNMTHTLAMEWASKGIRVNSVSPGFVRTQMTYFVDQTPDWELKMRYYGGMPRLADPKELGGAYVYLLSEGATYTTGIDLPVAGVVGAW